MMVGKVVPWDEEYRAISADLGRLKSVQFGKNSQAAILNLNRNQRRANSMSTLVALFALAMPVYSLVVDTKLTYWALVVPLFVVLSFLGWWAALTRQELRIWSRLERGESSYEEDSCRFRGCVRIGGSGTPLKQAQNRANDQRTSSTAAAGTTGFFSGYRNCHKVEARASCVAAGSGTIDKRPRQPRPHWGGVPKVNDE